MYYKNSTDESNSLWLNFTPPSLKASDKIGCIVAVVPKVIKPWGFLAVWLLKGETYSILWFSFYDLFWGEPWQKGAAL